MELFQSRASSIELLADPTNDDDIYRGQHLDQNPLESRSNTPSSSSSSSSSSAASGLGAIAAVVELAISRWARGNSSSSSLSSSSSSSSDSISTLSRPRRRRRRQALPSADHNARSERDILARLKARQETRQIPREFILYVPPVLHVSLPANIRRDKTIKEENGMLRTYLLPIILSRMNATLKASARVRQQDRVRLSKTADATLSSVPEPAIDAAPSRIPSLTELEELRQAIKGKQRETTSGSSFDFIKLPDSRTICQQPAWWLDVSSPTGEDMRALGKLLHLHPLTLEDILSRDPREKLEIFPKLGYYFVVFKAIESAKTQEKLDRVTRKDGQLVPISSEGIIGEDLVYLVVLRGGEGLCTFHFTDISEHLDRVREKVLIMDDSVNKSADWIAHGILDSVVDSFFPFLSDIGKEVDQIEDVVYSNATSPESNATNPEPTKTPDPPESTTKTAPTLKEKAQDSPEISINEKTAPPVISIQTKPRFRLPSTTLPVHFRRARRAFRSYLGRVFTRDAKPPVASSSTITVHRMARTRRLVTSLTRLLATKSDLIAQIKKRLLVNGKWTLGTDPELYIHLGDILDHILTLQQALAHYERMLSQSHPTYLSQLHLSATKTKSGSDKAIIVLTIISIGTLSIQTLIGVFSMNVRLPRNRKSTGYPFNVFAVVVSAAVIVLTIYLSFVRYIWVRAKGKRRTIT